MKKMKKLLSMLLAVVMVLAMAAPSFAAEGDTADNTTTTQPQITIDNPIANATYTAYKIFDVSYDLPNGNATTYAYSIKNNSAWFNIVKEYEGTFERDNDTTSVPLTKKNSEGKDIPVEIVLTKIPSENTSVIEYTVTFPKTGNKINLNPASFANYLKSMVKSVSDDGVTFTDGVANVELGYYFVTSTADTNTLCNLTTTEPNALIHDKNDIPFDKVEDKESVQVGQVVNYAINGKVPDTTGFTEWYDYIITDTMDSGLDFNQDSLGVFIGEKITLAEGQTPPADAYVVEKENNGEKESEYYTLTAVDTNNYTLNTTNLKDANATFELTIDVLKLQQDVTKLLVVKYSATVNENVVSTVKNNHAHLDFSNNPNNRTDKGVRDDDEKVYSAKVAINKYANDDKSDKLANAKFVLKKIENGTTMFYKYINTGDILGKDNDDNDVVALKDEVVWVSDIAKATVMTTGDGTNGTIEGYAEFKGLANSNEKIKYSLLETEAPAGYNLLEHEVEVIINGTNSDLGSLTVTKEISNATGTKLPSTGGIGTTIFYAAGIILMAGAVFFVVRRKKA